MEGSKIKDLSEDLQKASRVIVNQLKEYINRTRAVHDLLRQQNNYVSAMCGEHQASSSCHKTSDELDDKEASIANIEIKMKESQDLIKRFVDRDRENKCKLTSLLVENDRLKSSLDDLTNTFNETIVSTDTGDDQKTTTVTLPEDTRRQGKLSTDTSDDLKSKTATLPVYNRHQEKLSTDSKEGRKTTTATLPEDTRSQEKLSTDTSDDLKSKTATLPVYNRHQEKLSTDSKEGRKSKTATVHTYNCSQEKVSTKTKEEQRTQTVSLPEENRCQGNTGKMLVLRNPNMQVQRRQQDTRPRQTRTVIHPNVSFHRERLRERKKPPLVKIIWEWTMEVEQQQAKARANRLEDGIQTVICLDTSSSMLENNAWEQACVFLTDYINGLETEAVNRGTHKEYVGIVTFGFNTTVLHDLTNDYGKLREVLNSVEISGPSPLFHGLKMTGALWRGQDASNICTHYNIDEFAVHPKIILISDGQPTDTFLSQGPDRMYFDSEEEIKSKVLDITEGINKSLVDVVCVPVGDGNTEFLDLVVGFSDGDKLTHKDGHKMARRTTLTIQVAKELKEKEQNQVPLLLSGGDEMNSMLCIQHGSEEEMREKREILERSELKMEKRMDMITKGIYCERADDSLPPVGTRVRRGPDWLPTDASDGLGPGTIIGHDLSDERRKITSPYALPFQSCCLFYDVLNRSTIVNESRCNIHQTAFEEAKYELNVWVNWDLSRHLGAYRYGEAGLYDLVIVDEYTQLSIIHVMSVGCKVHPGVDWPSDETDRQLTGVSVQVSKRNKVAKTRIKWNNGKSGWYTAQDPEQVVVCGRWVKCLICDDRGRAVPQGVQRVNRPNKNKNKNIDKK